MTTNYRREEVHLFDYRLIIHDFIPKTMVQFRFPRSKKNRIKKKWAKRPENKKPCDQFIIDEVNKVIYGSRENIHKLMNQARSF